MGTPDGTLPGDCSLDRAAQTRNLLLFAACFGANYLAAPVGYVGVTQASLCEGLGAGETVANLPGALYLGMTVVPVLIAWLLPQVALLKLGLMTCYAATAASLATVAVLLVTPVSNELKIAAVIIQAAVAGVVNPAATMFLWEVVGRGVSAARRGPMLSLTFGAGPVLAALGSYGSHVLLTGRLGDIKLPVLEFPWNFAALYALAAPVMALPVLFSAFFVVPAPEREAVREPFLQGVFGGFRNFLSDRVLRWALIVTVLVYSGNAISSNMNLYTKALGELPKEYAGLHNTFRFGCKAVAGLPLGWLLLKTHPKAGLLATSLVYTAAVVWALVATGPWYHAAFLIFGAGELVGVYAPNYILSASRRRDIRRNMAIVTLLMAPAAVQGVLFGMIAEYGKRFGPTVGFRLSFAICAGLMIAGIVLAARLLPARPGWDETEGRAGTNELPEKTEHTVGESRES